MNLVTSIIFSVILQGLLLGTKLIVSRTANQRSNAYLGLLIIFFSLALVDAVLIYSDIYINYSYFLLIGESFLFLVGPFFYFYITSIFTSHQRLDVKSLIHFLPFCGYLIYMSLNFYFEPAQYKIDIIQENARFGFFRDVVVRIVLIGSIVGYLIRGKRLINASRKKTAGAGAARRNLQWVDVLTIMMIAILSFMAIGNSVKIYGLYNEIDFTFGYTWWIIALLIYGTGYRALLQKPEVFHLPENGKYVKSTLTKAKRSHYLKGLQDYIEKSKPYLNSDLTLSLLSDATDIPSKHLSQIINEQSGQNFNDFINSYRIDESTRLMKNSPHLNVYQTMLAAGFNSKSVFNTAFKKHTGLTPSQYKKRLKGSDS